MSYVRVVSGAHSGRTGEVLKSRGLYVLVELVTGPAWLHVADVRFLQAPPVDPTQVKAMRDRLLRGAGITTRRMTIEKGTRS